MNMFPVNGTVFLIRIKRVVIVFLFGQVFFAKGGDLHPYMMT